MAVEAPFEKTPVGNFAGAALGGSATRSYIGGMTPGGALPCMPLKFASMTATAILQHKGAKFKKGGSLHRSLLEQPYLVNYFDKLKSSSLHLLECLLAKMQHYASWGRKGRLGAAKSLSQTLQLINNGDATQHILQQGTFHFTLWSQPPKKRTRRHLILRGLPFCTPSKPKQ